MPEYYTTPITQFYKPDDKKEQSDAPFSAIRDKMLNESPIPTDDYQKSEYLNYMNNRLESVDQFKERMFQQKEQQRIQESFSPLNMAKNLVGGFLEGFTTIDLIDEPQNQYDAISYSLGHFLGFAGIVPMPGKIGRLIGSNLDSISKIIPKQMNASSIKSVGQRFLSGESRLKSVPMAAADWIMKGVNNYIFGDAKSNALKLFKEGSKVGDIVQSGLHLGFASAVSADEPWKLEIQKRFDAFLGGAEAGAVFQGINNVIGRQSGGAWMNFAKGEGMKEQLGNKVARGVAGSLYMGLPSTFAGEPTMFQIYNYIQGAGFGYLGHSAGEKHANTIIGRVLKEGKEGALLYPEEHKMENIVGYKYASDETKGILKEYALWDVGRQVILDFSNVLEDEKMLGIKGEDSIMGYINNNIPQVLQSSNILMEGYKKAGGKIEAQEAISEEAIKGRSKEAFFNKITERIVKGDLTQEEAGQMHQRRWRLEEMLGIKDLKDLEAQGKAILDSKKENEYSQNFIDNIFKHIPDKVKDLISQHLTTIGGIIDKESIVSYNFVINEVVKKYYELFKGEFENDVQYNKEVVKSTEEFIIDLTDKVKTLSYTVSGKYKQDMEKVNSGDEVKKLEVETEGKYKQVNDSILDKDKFIEEVITPGQNNEVIKEYIEDEVKRAYYIGDYTAKYVNDVVKRFQEKNPKGKPLELDGVVRIIKSFFQRMNDRTTNIRYEVVKRKDGNYDIVAFQDHLSDGTHVGKSPISTFTSNVKSKVYPIEYLDGKPLLEHDIEEIIPLIRNLISIKPELKDYALLGGGHHNRSLYLVKKEIKNIEVKDNPFVYQSNRGKEFDAFKVFPKLFEINKVNNKNETIDNLANSLVKDFLIFNPEEGEKNKGLVKNSFIYLLSGGKQGSLHHKGSQKFQDYISTYINNLAYYEIVNNRPYEESLSFKGSVKDIIEWTKRNKYSLFSDTSVNPIIWRGIISTTNDGYIRDKNGNIYGLQSAIFDVPKGYAERLVDGAVYMLKEDIDLINKYYDIDKGGIGFLKSTQVMDEFVGKNGIHEAPIKLATFMKGKGIRILYHKTATKIYGDKKVNTLTYGGEQYDMENLYNSKFTTKVGGLSLIPSSTFNSHLRDNQRFPIQMVTSLMRIKPGDIGSIGAIKQLFEPGFHGDIGENDKYEKMISYELAEDGTMKNRFIYPAEAESIDFDKLSIKNITSIVKRFYKSSDGNNQTDRKIFTAFLKHANKIIENQIGFLSEESEYLNDFENINQLKGTDVDGIVSMLGSANDIGTTVKILTSLEKPLMPGMFQLNTGITKNFEKFLKKYLLAKIFSPVIPNSMAGIITPHIHEQREDFRIKVLEKWGDNIDSGLNSYFFLGSGFKSKIITYDRPEGKVEESLERIWNRAEVNDPYAIKVIEDMTVARVPIDSMPGIAHGKFAGFTDEQGYGIHLSERDMAHLGGADVDADKTFIFFGLPEEYTKLIKDGRREFEDLGVDEYGSPIAVSALPQLNGKNLSIFQSVFMKNAIEDNEKKSVVMMFSPGLRMKTAYNSYKGNHLLGYTINRNNDGIAYANVLKFNEQTLDFLSLVKRDGLNMTVDSKGDGIPTMIDIDYILYRVLHDSGFRNALAIVPKGENKKDYNTALMNVAMPLIKQGYTGPNGELVPLIESEKNATLQWFKDNPLFNSIDFLLKAKNEKKLGVHDLALQINDHYAIVKKYLQEVNKDVSFEVKDPMKVEDVVLSLFPSVHSYYLQQLSPFTDGTTPENIVETLTGKERESMKKMFDTMHFFLQKFPQAKKLFKSFGHMSDLTGEFEFDIENPNWANIKDTKTILALMSSIPQMFGALEIAKKIEAKELENYENKSKIKYKDKDDGGKQFNDIVYDRAIKRIEKAVKMVHDTYIDPVRRLSLAVNLIRKKMEIMEEIDQIKTLPNIKKDALLDASIFLNIATTTDIEKINTFDQLSRSIEITKGMPLINESAIGKEALEKLLPTGNEKEKALQISNLIRKIKEGDYPDTYSLMKELQYFKDLSEDYKKLDELEKNILVTLSNFSSNSSYSQAFRTIKEKVENKIKSTNDPDLQKKLSEFLSYAEDVTEEIGGKDVTEVQYSEATRKKKSVLYEVFHNTSTTIRQFLDFLHPAFKKRDLEYMNNFFYYISERAAVDPFDVSFIGGVETIYGIKVPAGIKEYLETPLDKVMANKSLDYNLSRKIGEKINERHVELLQEYGGNFEIANEREQQLVDKATDFFRMFFQKHPEWANNTDIISKLISGTLEDYSFKPLRAITSMTYRQLDLALQQSINILNGKKPLKEFSKWNFFKMPGTIAKEQLEGGDVTISEEIGHTPLHLGLNKKGEPIIGEGKVRYWDSTFGIIHMINQNSNMISSALISNDKDELNEQYLYIFPQIEKEPYYEMFMKYLVFTREKNLHHKTYKENFKSLSKKDATGKSIIDKLKEVGEVRVSIKNRSGIPEQKYLSLIPERGKENLFEVVNYQLDKVFFKYNNKYINDEAYNEYMKDFNKLSIKDIKEKKSEAYKNFNEKYEKRYLRLFPRVKEEVNGVIIDMMDYEAAARALETAFRNHQLTDIPSMNIMNEFVTLFQLGNAKAEDGTLIRDIKDAPKRRNELAKILLRQHSRKKTILNINGEANYINTIDYKEYFPHKDHDLDISRAWITDMMSKIINGDKPIRSSIDIVDTLNKTLSGEHDINDPFYYDKKRVLKGFDMDSLGIQRNPQSLKGRNDGPFGPMPGWNLNHKILYRYIEDMNNGLMSKMVAILSHNRVREFDRRKPFGDNTGTWSDFMDIYIQQALGLPTFFPTDFLKSQGLSLTDFPYYQLTEQYWFDWAQKKAPHIFGAEFSPGVTWEQYYNFLKERKREKRVADKISVWQGMHPEGKSSFYTPKELESQREKFVNLDKEDWEVINSQVSDIINREKMSKLTNFLRNLSSLEGKWSIATLLFDTSSGMANWTTSHMNTAINIGIKDMWKGRQKKLWRTLWQEPNLSREEMNRRAQVSGAIESFLKNEVEFAKKNPEDMKNMLEDLGKYFDQKKSGGAKGNEVPLTLGGIASKYNVADRALEKAAWFMRSSEIWGRNDAWFSHYYSAYKSLNANNFSLPWDHPWLIRQANKGVRETQFLYDSASKPLFMTTSLGKIFSRFQNFLWNSLSWRRNIYNTAAEMGFDKNSESFIRLQRLMTADMFVLALASIFPASLFSKSVSQPWDWFVNLSDFMFGNDEEREGAFYGALPYPANILQPVLPPSSRYLTNVFSTMVGGDIDKLTNYYMWSWFPGGKMVKKVNHVIHSPSDVLDKVTGIPLKKIEKKIEDEESGKVEKERALSTFKTTFSKMFPKSEVEEESP